MLKFGSRKKIVNSPFILPALALSSMAVIMAVSVIASLFVMRTDNPLLSIGISSFLSLIISGIISGIINQRTLGDIGRAISATGICAVCIALLAIIFGNGIQGCLNALCFFGPGALASLFIKSFSGKRRHRH